MKLCTVIVLLKAYQNTKKNSKILPMTSQYRHYEKQWEIQTFFKPEKLYIIRKLMMRALRKM